MKESSQDICIIQCGAQTPVGISAEMTAASIRAGITRILEHSEFEDEGWSPIKLGIAEYIEEYVEIDGRMVELLLPALEETLVPLIKNKIPQQTIPLLIGLPEKRPGLPLDIEPIISQPIYKLGKEVKYDFQIEFLYEGHSSSLMALKNAQKMLLEGSCKFCIVGGVDSYVDEETIKWLEENKKLFCPNNTNGFIPGEGFIAVVS